MLSVSRQWVYISSRGVGLVALFHLHPTKQQMVKVQEFRLAGTWPRSRALSRKVDTKLDIRNMYLH